MTAMFGMLKDQFGIDVAHLMQAKTAGAPESVAKELVSNELLANELVVAFEESEASSKSARATPLGQNGASRV
jgi:HPt (histidine-containing phosphotransfer) domain-containing protein